MSEAPPDPESAHDDPGNATHSSAADSRAAESLARTAELDEVGPREAPLSPRFHSPREALSLLALCFVGHLLIQGSRGWGSLARDLAPALQVLVWILPAYLLLQRRGEDPWIRHGLTSKTRGILPALGVSLAILLGFVGVCASLSTDPAAAPLWGELLAQVPQQLVFVALQEEYFFRGVLQPALEPAGGPTRKILGAPMGRGALAASALFALAHLDPSQGLHPGRLLTFFPALWFAWLRARTGSILPAILAHAAANLTGQACLESFGVGFGRIPPG